MQHVLMYCKWCCKAMLVRMLPESGGSESASRWHAAAIASSTAGDGVCLQANIYITYLICIKLDSDDNTAAKQRRFHRCCIVCCITSSVVQYAAEAGGSLHHVGTYLVTYCLIRAIHLEMTASLQKKGISV
jgi:hypothetical protein